MDFCLLMYEKVFRLLYPKYIMNPRCTLIYFGEEIHDFNVEVRGDTILINGRPLIPPYSALTVEEESPFSLDIKTQKTIEKSLELLNPTLSFDENAERVAAFLQEKGLTVRRGEFYGDVLLETDEGWGVTVLFNEEARIKKSKPFKGVQREPPPTLTEILEEGLVIVDKGVMSLIPEKEAERILENLKEIYASPEDLPVKIKKVENLLGIQKESARKLLMQH
jgi:hypothetical protein